MTDQAMESPSYVLVPRPTSSKIKRLSLVACRRMDATSVISTMNVLWSKMRLSLAPTRVKMRSVSGIFASFAGTKQPRCAIKTMSATCRIYVLLPAIFGPVMIALRFSPLSKRVSLGTKRSLEIASTTG